MRRGLGLPHAEAALITPAVMATETETGNGNGRGTDHRFA
jgi:hypothetical protein